MGTNGVHVSFGAGHEMGGVMGNGSGQPPATEYTLQGVMRFLQTEWHRHERDRNAWEIEKQEMRARIANLEGQARRADATQKALKRYVAILEKKVKEQSAALKGTGKEKGAEGEAAESEENKTKLDRSALIQEKLRPNTKLSGAPHEAESVEIGPPDDESARNELKTFLDQCQAEFTYLMVTPANPQPPRESPPLPILDDFREGEVLNQQLEQSYQRSQQSQIRDLLAQQAAAANATNAAAVQSQQQQPQQQHVAGPRPQTNQPPKGYGELQGAPMERSSRGQQLHDILKSGETPDWSASMQSQPAEEPTSALSKAPPMVRGDGREPAAPKPSSTTDAWDFNESNFQDPTAMTQPTPQQSFSSRPDTDAFPSAENLTKSPNRGALSHRRKSSSGMARRRSAEHELSLGSLNQKSEGTMFKFRFGLRGHLDVVRTVIFSGGGSPGEPEICTAGDDGLVKRFHIPDRHIGQRNADGDLDVAADFTHRGHSGAVLSLASWSPSPNFSTGGRAQGDGWIFSGGQDATIRVWERGRVDPKATLDGHTDAVWALCVLPTNLGAIFGQTNNHGPPDRILLVSGAADGTVKVWAVSAPPQLTSPQPGPGRRGPGGRVRGNSMSSGSAFPSSPQPTTASNSPFHHTLVHTIKRANSEASPTCITALSPNGETFAVSYADAAIIVYDTRSGEEIGTMASLDTYDGTINTAVNAVVATTVGLDQTQGPGGEDESGGGPTGGGRSMAGSGVEGTIISGHEDRYIRFFDANSGQCTYNMLAHPGSVSSLSLSPDGRELVSAGHDMSLRFWSLETRSCTQEMTCHRSMRGEGVCAVVWSQDGRWVVSSGGDGMVKVYAR